MLLSSIQSKSLPRIFFSELESLSKVSIKNPIRQEIKKISHDYCLQALRSYRAQPSSDVKKMFEKILRDTIRLNNSYNQLFAQDPKNFNRTPLSEISEFILIKHLKYDSEFSHDLLQALDRLEAGCTKAIKDITLQQEKYKKRNDHHSSLKSSKGRPRNTPQNYFIEKMAKVYKKAEGHAAANYTVSNGKKYY